MKYLPFLPISSRARSLAVALTQSAAVAGLALAGLQGQASAATYTNDFSGTGTNTAFSTETSDAEWTVTGGSYAFSYSNSTITPSTASVPIAGVGGASFTVETQFTVTTTGVINSNGATLGFGLFGASATFATGSYYLADWSVASPGTPGNLRILSQNDSSGFTSTATTVDANLATSNLAIELGSTYTLRLVGSYSGSTLNMSLGVFDLTGTQIGTSATASDTSPLTGTNFGYRNRIGLGSGTFNAAFDNFSVIPEPGSVALLSLGATALLVGRRRASVRL